MELDPKIELKSTRLGDFQLPPRHSPETKVPGNMPYDTTARSGRSIHTHAHMAERSAPLNDVGGAIEHARCIGLLKTH